MRFPAAAATVLLAGLVAACGDTPSAPDPVGDGPEIPPAECELISTTPLADANEVAPNGRSGAEIIAVIPEDFETNLHWDFVNESGEVEVEVVGATNPSTGLSLAFDVPAAPTFRFEDYEPTEETRRFHDVTCDDRVVTTIGLSMTTGDGAIDVSIPAVEVRLSDADSGFPDPMVFGRTAMATPLVNFVTPVAQPADVDKRLSMVFDVAGVTGNLAAFTTAGESEYAIWVAEW